ncbi:hypothetical protein J2Y63_002456 [Shinella sp. BE166]|uniref:hypothetical protein n=1 Tax=Shinella sp. BE166 TaxID=3373918 RepID=UPI003EBB1AF6
MKPGARKSLGEYKPLIIHPNGRTEVLGQAGHLQRIQAQTKFYGGPDQIWHGERGKTFPTRGEAVAYAEKQIAARAARDAERAAAHAARLESYARQRASINTSGTPNGEQQHG